MLSGRLDILVNNAATYVSKKLPTRPKTSGHTWLPSISLVFLTAASKQFAKICAKSLEMNVRGRNHQYQSQHG